MTTSKSSYNSTYPTTLFLSILGILISSPCNPYWHIFINPTLEKSKLAPVPRSFWNITYPNYHVFLCSLFLVSLESKYHIIQFPQFILQSVNMIFIANSVYSDYVIYILEISTDLERKGHYVFYVMTFFTVFALSFKWLIIL